MEFWEEQMVVVGLIRRGGVVSGRYWEEERGNAFPYSKREA